MAQFNASDPGYKHRLEYFARKLNALQPSKTFQLEIYDPFGAEAEYYRQLNLGNIPDPLFAPNTVPTLAAGSNAGTTPPAPVLVAGSNDQRGGVTFGTGATPAAGNMVVVTFGAAYSAAPFVGLDSASNAGAGLQPYVTSVSTTGFTIGFATAPAASQANTTYAINYRVN